jgi:DNA-binding CsgD family transcriptional regulator
MKSILHTLWICLYCFMPLTGFGQINLADSLRSVTDNMLLSEKEKPILLNRLAEIYRVNKNYKAAETTAVKSAAIAMRYKNYREATKAYTLLANIKANTQQFGSLKNLSDSAWTVAEQAKDPIATAYGYYSRVLLYKMLDDAEAVVKNCNAGLKQLEHSADPYLAAKIYYQLYVVHADWNNEEKVNTYARKATDNALQAKDYNLLSNCYTAMSIAQEYNYNASKQSSARDSILFYLNKSEMLYREYPGQVADYTYAIACVNIANCYLKYFPETDKEAQKNAVSYAHTARAILKNAANSQDVIASSLGILSEYARRQGNDAQVESYLQEAYQLMKTDQHPYYYTMINIVQSMADFYERKGDVRKALGYQKEVTLFNNKNFNQKQALNAQKLEIQYETEQKNNEMRMLKEREKSQRLQNYLYGCIALASLLGLLFMFRSYHFRLRYSLQREKQLQLEKQDSELQVKLEREEQARLKAEQLLLETQQQQLEKEVMANVLQLEHKNKMLLDIKDRLSEGDPVNMQKILKEEMVLDSDFEQAQLQIRQVHPGFFNLLSDKAQKRLTPLDLKLCAYLYLKMDTRQIAQLMHIEPKSVRMSRYRIKQKLGLEKEEDLYGYLQGLGH